MSDWQLGFQRDRGPRQGTITEFVPRGEHIDHWSKLLSIEFVETVKIPFDKYVQLFSTQRTLQCPGTTFKILNQTSTSSIYMVEFPTCMGHEQQAELTKVFQGNDGIHRISYAEKAKSLSPETVSHWLSLFETAYVEKRPNGASH